MMISQDIGKNVFTTGSITWSHNSGQESFVSSRFLGYNNSFSPWTLKQRAQQLLTNKLQSQAFAILPFPALKSSQEREVLG